ncbi:hypothetical protein SCP_1503180 [Sparassis crispa]|uniref:BTB domain-containing protein n=1 Tax=Sparassis crispa TaxID=139825 RepID=A0A401H4N0_9APHY|nr:hypothetical protein SCP_1503180 [Sparassis crispa]GBE89310.1 hypothetical protein SCP_1503180 [Sparassis crispa]
MDSSTSLSSTDIRMELEGEEGELRKDDEFWFTDGNIVLITRNVAFRVHQGVLSRHSDVFRDLFTVPQPAVQERMFDSPVVRLSDSASDLRHLLRVLYDGRRFYLMREDRLPFAAVEALVRLGQKYEIQDLREQGLVLLKAVFPDNFLAWNASLKANSEDTSTVVMETTDAIAAVNLARVIGCRSMLPAALYRCCQLSAAELCGGVSRGDGHTEQLSAEDVERCIDAKARLMSAYAVGRMRRYSMASTDCLRKPMCAATMHSVLQRSVDSYPRRVKIQQCETLDDMDRTIDLLRGLCVIYVGDYLTRCLETGAITIQGNVLYSGYSEVYASASSCG